MNPKQRHRGLVARIGRGWLQQGQRQESPAVEPNARAVRQSGCQQEFRFDPRPREIVTENSQEYFALCERQRAGELVIESVSVGKTQAQYVCRVRYCV